jgi:hypothetical protein
MMHAIRWRRGAATALLVWVSALAGEPHIGTASTVFHQVVTFSLPGEFKSARPFFEKNNGSFYTSEHVPAGETAERWTQMITLSGTKDLALNAAVTVREAITPLATGFQRHCPESFTSTDLGAQNVTGAQGAAAMVVGCGRVQAGSDAHSETALILAIKGSADYYTLQWVRRGSPSNSAPALDAAYWSKQLERLQPIRLCAPDGSPCGGG